MANRFDFTRIGKEMPYTVPDGFFDEFERTIASKVNIAVPTATPKRSAQVRILVRTLSAAAAVAAIIFTAFALSPTRAPEPSMTLEQAFANLDTTDQEYLLDTYNDVSYISDQL